MSDVKDVTFSLKVMINKEKNKVLFAEADSDFTDVLLSFLTLPLGRIVKVLQKHYGDRAPIIGSLTSLFNGLSNLDNVHFWTEDAKLILLNAISSFEGEYKRLKVNISDSLPAEYFHCQWCRHKFQGVSMYYDAVIACKSCRQSAVTKVVEKYSQASVCGDGVFTINTASFIISDDLQILPNATGLLQIISVLGIKNVEEAELMNVTLGFSEIMDLLKGSLISPTPLSDLILNKTRPSTNSATAKSEQGTILFENEKVSNSNSKKMMLKVMMQISTNKLLFVQAKEDFVEFLFGFLTIPLAGVECLLASKANIKSIDNLYGSVANLIEDKYLKTTNTKNNLIKPKLPHGYLSENHIFPLVEECLPDAYKEISQFRSVKFPKGQGNYLKGPRDYMITDDLTVTPFCITSVLSIIKGLKIPISDVKELELEIGLEEALGILKASLTSTSALTNGLANYIVKERQPKQENWV